MRKAAAATSGLPHTEGELFDIQLEWLPDLKAAKFPGASAALLLPKLAWWRGQPVCSFVGMVTFLKQMPLLFEPQLALSFKREVQSLSWNCLMRPSNFFQSTVETEAS